MNAVNLIPSDERRRGRSVATGLPFIGLVGGLAIVLAATVLFVLAHNRVESKQSQLTAVQASTARWAAAAGSFGHALTAAKQQQSTIATVEGLVGQRANWSELLSQLAAVMPARSQISSMSASAAASAPTGATTATTAAPAAASSTGTAATGSSIQLAACAKNQSVVAQSLINLRRITGVSQVDLASSGSSGSGGSGGSTSCSYPVSFSVTLAFQPPTLSAGTIAMQPASDTTSVKGSSGVSQ